MAKIYGSLVGALIQSNNGFAAVPNRFKDGSDAILIRDTVLTSTNLIGDTISFGTFKSNAFLDPSGCVIWYDAFGAGCTLNIGDVNHAAGLASAIDIHAAGGPTAINGTFLAAAMGQPLWKRLGYATDPGGLIELLATFAGANPNNANLAWKIVGQNA